MKKVLILVAVSAMFFTSCKKYDISDPVDVNNFPKVRISGVVKADFDATKPGNEFVPAGTQLVFKATNASYDSDAVGNQIFVVTVGNNGEYSVDIPVPTAGVNVNVNSNDFIASYTSTDLVKFNKKYVFNAPAAAIGCTQNVNKIINFDFTGTEINVIGEENRIIPTSTSKISGKLEYLSKTDNLGAENFIPIPSGKKVKVKITLTEYAATTPTGKYIEEKEIVVGSEGKYEISVPMIVDGKAVVEISAVENFEYTLYTTATDYTKKYCRYELDKSITIYEIDLVDKDYKYSKDITLN